MPLRRRAAPLIPAIDIGSLFGEACAARRAADQAIAAAATGMGFMQVGGLPDFIPCTRPQLQQLKRIFALEPAAQRRLWRQKFAPENTNVYRGWFPLQEGHATFKEGIDLGADLAHGSERIVADDPLCEASPLPTESSLPGWRAAAAAYFRGMEQTGQVLMRAIARGLGLAENIFEASFERGNSTLRIIRYPARPASEPLSGAEHVDSGLMTLLAQDGVPGLQAKARTGAWVDVSASPEMLVVNFGRLLELWSEGRIRATEHRVAGTRQERYSIPFFYEPRVDALIAPLPRGPHAVTPPPFSPFLYGDFVWAQAMRFVEFSGLAHLRAPRGGDLPGTV